jgi:emp24/gp25L/p24 family/GOLD
MPKIRRHNWLQHLVLRIDCWMFFLWTLTQQPQQVAAMPWIVTVDPYDDSCFLVKVPTSTEKPKILVGDYELLDYSSSREISAEPLLVYVMENGRNGKEKISWRSSPGAAKGAFRVPMKRTASGYWICLQNSNHAPDNTEPEDEHPDHIARMVGFEFRVENMILDIKPAPIIFTADHGDEWRDRSHEVQQELRSMENHRSYMRMREADHRVLVEKTFVSTLTWTLTEAVVVIAMAVGQILYFRRFLEKNNFLKSKS